MAWHAVWRGVARRGAAWRVVARRGAAWWENRVQVLSRGTDMEALSHTRQCAVRLTLQAKSLQVDSMYNKPACGFRGCVARFRGHQGDWPAFGKMYRSNKKRTVRYGEVR